MDTTTSSTIASRPANATRLTSARTSWSEALSRSSTPAGIHTATDIESSVVQISPWGRPMIRRSLLNNLTRRSRRSANGSAHVSQT